MNAVARGHTVRVEPATLDDWPAILGLRRAYFAKMGVRYVRHAPEIRWVVALAGLDVVGVLGYLDVSNAGELWCTDLYRVDGPLGTAATFRLVRWITDLERRYEASIQFAVDLDNLEMYQAVVKHGFEPRAMIFGRKG